MTETTPLPFSVGFSEMWKPVYTKYKGFFDCGQKLQPIASEMFKAPIRGELQIVVGHLTAAVANSYGAFTDVGFERLRS